MVDKQGGQNPKTGRKDELKVNLGFYTARLLYDLFKRSESRIPSV